MEHMKKTEKMSFRKNYGFFLFLSVFIYLYLYLSLRNSRPHKPGCLANYPLMCLFVRT